MSSILAQDVQFFNAISDGRSGTQLVADLKRKGVDVHSMLEDFASTPQLQISEGRIYRFVLFPAKDLNNQTVGDILDFIQDLGGNIATVESTLLLRERYTQKQLGHPHVLVMHEPIDEKYMIGLHSPHEQDNLFYWVIDRSTVFNQQIMCEFMCAFLLDKSNQSGLICTDPLYWSDSDRAERRVARAWGNPNPREMNPSAHDRYTRQLEEARRSGKKEGGNQ